MTTGARWDGDAGGPGIGSAESLAPGVRRLVDDMSEGGWVTEDPETHLLPHIRRFCEESEGTWALVSAGLDGPAFVVTLRWTFEPARIGALRQCVYALLGSFSESTSYIRQRVADDQVVYEVATGILEGDSTFRGHGHLVRLHVTGDSARAAATAAFAGP
ncbi:MAG: hypothetical protein ABR532_00225 [Candidatus Dormibacteria bacterium]